jgi:CxxC motif-containing protein
MTELTCIVCPVGCRLKVDEENGYAVKGNTCKRGEVYGKNELQNPTRVLTTTVAIEGGTHGRCPVRTNGAIPKSKIFEAMDVLKKLRLTAPVRCGEVVLKNILGTGIDVIATRDM